MNRDIKSDILSAVITIAISIKDRKGNHERLR